MTLDGTRAGSLRSMNSAEHVPVPLSQKAIGANSRAVISTGLRELIVDWLRHAYRRSLQLFQSKRGQLHC